MNENLKLYNELRAVPDNAKRTIPAGKLKGKTDINPMWRIKALTERFGPCGTGWGYTIDRLWSEPAANGEVAAFCQLTLWYMDGSRREVQGLGGNMLVQLEKGKLASNDEAYKMALTDALGTAAKAIGLGADVWWEQDATKYTSRKPDGPVCEMCGKPVKPGRKKDGSAWPAEDIAAWTQRQHGRAVCWDCHKKLKSQADARMAQDAAAQLAAHEDGGDRA